MHYSSGPFHTNKGKIKVLGLENDTHIEHNQLIESNVEDLIKEQEKLSKYTEDVKHYMWKTKNTAKNYLDIMEVTTKSKKSIPTIPPYI